MIDKDELHTAIHEYLKENLEVTVWTEKHYGEYSGADGVKVTVMVNLDGELITESYDYTGL